MNVRRSLRGGSFKPIKQKLLIVNRRLVNIEPDGNCLYRCFAKHYDGGSGVFQQYKDTCANFIENHKAVVSGFVTNNLTEYCAKLRNPTDKSMWGGELELSILARTYEVNVRVYESRNREFRIREFRIDVTAPTIEVAYNGSHYQYVEIQGEHEYVCFVFPLRQKNIIMCFLGLASITEN